MRRTSPRSKASWARSIREEVVHQVLRGGSTMLFLLVPLAALLVLTVGASGLALF